jgi:4-diphosphocytidyl-2C-methyl-D-erythritol kinase
MLGILSKLPNLERLALTVELTYHLAITLGNDVPMFLRPIAQKLGEGCSRLRSVQLILKSEWLVTDGPLVVEYKIHRNTGMEVEILAPRLLEGTVFEFLLYR